MQQLAREFVPVADDEYRLRRGSDLENRIFRGVAALGHYGRVPDPNSTRQGVYMLTSSGVFLASTNELKPGAVAKVMRQALDKYKRLRGADRRDNQPLSTGPSGAAQSYPVGGLVLRLYSRDLPLQRLSEQDWRSDAWNTDMAWFRKEEARQWLPGDLRVGAKAEVPQGQIMRLARFHLEDNVRGQTEPWPAGAIRQARLQSTVTAVDGGLVKLRLEGATSAYMEGYWSESGAVDARPNVKKVRTMNLKLLGYATYDARRERFTSFEMLAVGSRSGGSPYNQRHDSGGKEDGIGFYFTLAGDSAADRLPPAQWEQYGW